MASGQRGNAPPTLSWAAVALVTGSETGAPGWGRGGHSGRGWEVVRGRGRSPGLRGPRSQALLAWTLLPQLAAFGESYSPISHSSPTPRIAGLPEGGGPNPA